MDQDVDVDLEIGDGLNKSGQTSGFKWFKIQHACTILFYSKINSQSARIIDLALSKGCFALII